LEALITELSYVEAATEFTGFVARDKWIEYKLTGKWSADILVYRIIVGQLLGVRESKVRMIQRFVRTRNNIWRVKLEGEREDKAAMILCFLPTS